MFTQNYVAYIPSLTCCLFVANDCVPCVNTECTATHSVTLSLLLASLEVRNHVLGVVRLLLSLSCISSLFELTPKTWQFETRSSYKNIAANFPVSTA